MAQSTRRLRIAYLLEDTYEPWGGVEMILREAEALRERGHELTLYSHSPRPDWAEVTVRYEQLESFDRTHLEPQDILIGSFFTTVEAARIAGLGRPVHYCQGFEADSPDASEIQASVDAAYLLQGLDRLVISPLLQRRLRERYGIESHLIPYGVRRELFAPGEASAAAARSQARIALIGPWEVSWKDIRTGVRAVRALHEARGGVQLVRVSPTPILDEEREAWGDVPVEWHVKLRQDQMPEIYRSCDVFLGTSNGGAEGFFLPAMEAMSCGIPTILTDIECFRQYSPQHDFTSFVRPGDAAALAQELARYLEDPALREQRRQRGLEVAATHDFERHVDALERYFDGLVAPGAALLEGAPPALPKGEDEALVIQQRACHELMRLATGPFSRRESRLAALDAMLCIDPQHVTALHWTARILADSEPERALECLERALEVDPLSPGLNRRHGQVLANLGRMEEAHAALLRSVELGQPGGNVFLELCLVGTRRGNWNELAEWISEAGQRGPLDELGQELFAKLQQSIASSGFAAVRS